MAPYFFAFVVRLVCSPVGWLAGWLATGWLVDWLIGWLVGWLAGLMAGWLLYLLCLLTALLCFACLSARLLCLDIWRFALALLDFFCFLYLLGYLRVCYISLHLLSLVRPVNSNSLRWLAYWGRSLVCSDHSRMTRFWTLLKSIFLTETAILVWCFGSWAWFFWRPLQEGNFQIFLPILQLHQPI